MSDDMRNATQGALELYLNEVQPVDGRVQINVSIDELAVLRHLAGAGEVFYFGTDPKALADRIISIQEDLPDETDRAALGEVAHYLRKAVAPPASPLRGRELSENEHHAIGHARYQVDHATPENPDCCFDYELVRTLLSLIASPPEQPAAANVRAQCAPSRDDIRNAIRSGFAKRGLSARWEILDDITDAVCAVTSTECGDGK